MRTVEEIKADIASCDSAWIDSALCRSLRCELYETILGDIPLDRLETICAAERDGRCVVLPCKAGDTVYKISYDCTERIRYNPFDENGCSTAEICLKCDTNPCDIHKTVIPVTAESKDWMWENKAAFGRTVFLTIAEAEKVLGKEAQS